MRAFFSLSVGLALAALTTASPTYPRADKVVHEVRNPKASNWNAVDRVDPKAPLTVRIGLKQSNLDKAAEYIADVYVLPALDWSRDD